MPQAVGSPGFLRVPRPRTWTWMRQTGIRARLALWIGDERGVVVGDRVVPSLA